MRHSVSLLSNVLSTLHFKFIVWFSRTHSAVLRMSGGRLMHSLLGMNMLLLSTVGRRTRHSRDTPLLYMEIDGYYYCVASFAGSDRHPQWFLNLVSNPEVQLLVRRRHLTALAHVTSGQERSEAWDELVGYYPAFAKYQRRTGRAIPVVRFSPVPNSRKA